MPYEMTEGVLRSARGFHTLRDGALAVRLAPADDCDDDAPPVAWDVVHSLYLRAGQFGGPLPLHVFVCALLRRVKLVAVRLTQEVGVALARCHALKRLALIACTAKPDALATLRSPSVERLTVHLIDSEGTLRLDAAAFPRLAVLKLDLGRAYVSGADAGSDGVHIRMPTHVVYAGLDGRTLDAFSLFAREDDCGLLAAAEWPAHARAVVLHVALASAARMLDDRDALSDPAARAWFHSARAALVGGIGPLWRIFLFAGRAGAVELVARAMQCAAGHAVELRGLLPYMLGLAPCEWNVAPPPRAMFTAAALFALPVNAGRPADAELLNTEGMRSAAPYYLAPSSLAVWRLPSVAPAPCAVCAAEVAKALRLQPLA